MKNLKGFLEENTTPNRYIWGLNLRDAIHTVVKNGSEQHLDKFVDYPDEHVRAAVAQRGFESHLDKLVDDHDYVVRSAVAETAPKKYVDHIVDNQIMPDQNPDLDVAAEVVMRDFRDHAEKMADHPNPRIRRTVAKYTNHKDIIEKLMNDSDAAVAERARINMNNQKRFGTASGEWI